MRVFRQFMLLVLVSLCFASGLSAQSTRRVVGVVKDAQGEPIIGATVVPVGATASGAVTDLDGNYAVNVPQGITRLSFSFVGMKGQTIDINGRNRIDVVLESSAEELDILVVTALGIKRTEKSLSYATQKVKGDALTQVPSTNFLSNLSGKSAGMQVVGGGGAPGSSVKITLRGNRSIQGNNAPLYVVDGTPINSTIFSNGGADGGYGGGIDVGDGLSAINPEDIEDIQVLKGASAAALYGSQAANGVIMITTKKGKEGKTSISLSTSIQAEIPVMTYEFQDRYAAGTGGVSQSSNLSWGARQSTPFSNSYIRDYFSTGTSYITGVSISGGSDKMRSFLSYQNTTSEGIIKGNEMNKHNLAVRTSIDLFGKFLEADGSVNLTKQNLDHVPTAPGQYFNPMVGLYLFSGGGTEGIRKYEENPLTMNANNIAVHNWNVNQDINFNPYWLREHHNYYSELYKAIAKVNLKFNFTDFLNLQLRGSYDRSWIENTREVGVAQFPSGTTGGRYDWQKLDYTEAYGDALLNFNKNFVDDRLSVLATVGTSITDNQFTSRGTNVGNLAIPLIYTPTNSTDGKPGVPLAKEHRQLQSVFGTLSLGWDDLIFLDMTARNDWASTLPASNRSFFYPSIGASFIFSKLLKDSGANLDWLSFGKLRASWTQVGNAMPWGLTYSDATIKSGGSITAPTIKAFTDLKPERSTATEFGLNLNLFQSRLTFDIAYYTTDTENQYFQLDNSPSSGIDKYYINAGKVRNTGLEMTLGYTPVRTKDFEWTGYVNFSTNKNTVVTLPEQYAAQGMTIGKGAFEYRLFEGQEWGQIYMKRLQHDEEGRVKVFQDASSKLSLAQTQDAEYIGNVNPDFLLGIGNTFTYKGIGLSFLIDGRFGGKVISTTQAFLNSYGRSLVSGEAREAGGVSVPAVLVASDGLTKPVAYDKPLDAQMYYQTATAADMALYDATNVRLRELSLSYSLPSSVLEKTKFLTGVRFSLIGRNLFFLYRDAPYDPEITMATKSNAGTNADNFSLPATKSIGFSVNINF